MAASLLVPDAAHADYYGRETDFAVVLGSGDTPAEWGDEYDCIGSTGVTVCFMPYGHKIFVKDDKADGYTAVGEWFIDTGDGYRSGSRVNKHTAGTWAQCNKDFPEDRIRYRGARYNSGNSVDGGEWDWYIT
jgi:hypothetical protein